MSRQHFRVNGLFDTMAVFISDRTDALFEPVFKKWFTWARPIISHVNKGNITVRPEYLREKFREIWLDVDRG